MSYTPDVQAMLDVLAPGVRQVLGENFVGLYLRGSLALGDFNPDTSDLDFLVVTVRPVSGEEFEGLEELHAQLASMPNKYAHHLEGSYIDRTALRTFKPTERRHPTIGTDWPLKWAEHRANWILERWVLREHGIVVDGPDIRPLIDPISPEEILAAVLAELEACAEWAAEPEGPDWLLPRNYQAFVVETMCRAMYTLDSGKLPTKPQAVRWAGENVPEPWRSLVVESQEWRAEEAGDPTTLPKVKAFVRWVEESGQPSPT